MRQPRRENIPDIKKENIQYGENIIMLYPLEKILLFYSISFCKGKDKTIPLQAWTGPEGSRRLRLPYFKTIGTRRW
jgi:hypothetical protein